MEWRTMTDEKEKYAAYLCSREWAEKREAVRSRASNRCERCEVLPMAACHHLTYKRKYKERLEDLQAICNPCHEFTHGKNDIDPCSMQAWLYYVHDCKRSGRRPIGLEWRGGPQCERDAVERAVVFLLEKDIEAQDYLYWLQACGLLSEEDVEIASDCHFQSAAIEIEKLLNTSIVDWFVYRRPTPPTWKHEKACSEWFRLPTPRELPTRKSDQEEAGKDA